jgi:hypothetical protein
VTDRETFPDLRERFGEDPARYLDRDLMERDGTRVTYGTDHRGRTTANIRADEDTSPHGERVRQRIEGIRSLELLRAWRAVERRLGRGPSGEPRQKVLDWIDEREKELAEPNPRAVGPIRSTVSCATWPDRDGGERSSTFQRSERTFGEV